MNESYLYLFIKAIVTLAVVLGVMALVLYALKRFLNLAPGANGGSNPVKVLSTSFLGPKRNLAIVEVAGEVLVLGITPASITCLTKVEDPKKIDELKKMNASKKSIFGLFQAPNGK